MLRRILRCAAVVAFRRALSTDPLQKLPETAVSRKELRGLVRDPAPAPLVPVFQVGPDSCDDSPGSVVGILLMFRQPPGALL